MVLIVRNIGKFNPNVSIGGPVRPTMCKPIPLYYATCPSYTT